MNWHYEEITCVDNKLEFFASIGTIEIRFDINGNPSIHGVLPKSDVPELLAMIKERYPNGFHSRVDNCIDWLRTRLEELAAKASIQIKSFVPYGCLMLNGINYDAYKLEVNHERITSPIYVAMTSSLEEFVLFRPYIPLTEFGRDKNIGVFGAETEYAFSVADEAIYFKDEIVSYKTYEYEYNGEELISTSYGFKNNKLGFMYESKFGKFLAAGGTSYLS